MWWQLHLTRGLRQVNDLPPYREIAHCLALHSGCAGVWSLEFMGALTSTLWSDPKPTIHSSKEKKKQSSLMIPNMVRAENWPSSCLLLRVCHKYGKTIRERGGTVDVLPVLASALYPFRTYDVKVWKVESASDFLPSSGLAASAWLASAFWELPSSLDSCFALRHSTVSELSCAFPLFFCFTLLLFQHLCCFSSTCGDQLHFGLSVWLSVLLFMVVGCAVSLSFLHCTYILHNSHGQGNWFALGLRFCLSPNGVVLPHNLDTKFLECRCPL